MISPGRAEGILHLHRDLLGHIDAPEDIEPHAVEEEFLRLDVATTRIADDLLTLATRVEEEIDSRLAEVFGAYQLILGDFSLRDELRREIAENLLTSATQGAWALVDADAATVKIDSREENRTDYQRALGVSVAPPLVPMIKEAIRGSKAYPSTT